MLIANFRIGDPPLQTMAVIAGLAIEMAWFAGSLFTPYHLVHALYRWNRRPPR